MPLAVSMRNGCASTCQRCGPRRAEARAPSAGYRLRKLAHKHRTAFTVAAGFILVLLLGAEVNAAITHAERAGADPTVSRVRRTA